MPNQIYNEGRVVGYSAYELYVRGLLAIDPNAEPATEREWLASSLAMGSTVILKVPADDVSTTGLHVVDIPIPSGSNLRAANSIIGNWTNIQIGENSSNIPDRVISYSDDLIPNNEDESPNSGPVAAADLPTATTLTGYTQADEEAIRNYLKLQDGVVLQGGTWSTNTTNLHEPEKILEPDLSDTPIVRLLVNGNISADFYIQLTGFTDAGVLVGTSGLSGVSSSPEDSDFLGPAVFPWASKIIFTLNNSMQAIISSLSSASLTRTLPNLTSKSVTSSAIVDLEDAELDWYSTYASGKYQDSIVSESVTGFTPDSVGDSVLTGYSRYNGAPPALYASKVTDTGDIDLSPLDVITPGTVKIFDNKAELELYLDNTKNVYALYKNPDSTTLEWVTKSGNAYTYTVIAKPIELRQFTNSSQYGITTWGVNIGDNKWCLALSGMDGSDLKQLPYTIAKSATVRVQNNDGKLTSNDILALFWVNEDGKSDPHGNNMGYADVWGNVLRGLNQCVRSAGLVPASSTTREHYQIQLNDGVSISIPMDSVGWSIHADGAAEFGKTMSNPYIKIGSKKLYLSRPSSGASNGDIGIW